MIGHNPKANGQIDELPEITALLRELPRVSAPTDFNASLQARLAAAKAAAKVEADEFAGVTALMIELPRVAAPPDFDFKLRARIAQAKAAEQETSAGWFARLFGRSFSWLQASAAMAAVAIVVSAVTFGVLRSDDNINSSSGQITVAKAIDPAPTVAPPTDATTTETLMPGESNALPATVNNASTPTSIKTQPIKHVNRLVTTGSGSSVLPRRPAPPAEMAGVVATKVMIKSRTGEARMVNLSEYNLGLQTAHLRSTPKAATNRNDAAMANIF